MALPPSRLVGSNRSMGRTTSAAHATRSVRTRERTGTRGRPPASPDSQARWRRPSWSTPAHVEGTKMQLIPVHPPPDGPRAARGRQRRERLERTADLHCPPSAGLPRAHSGVHVGPVVFREGDFFGRTVNLAARMADDARPGEVLVSDAAVSCSDGEGMEFSDLGAIDLKGISEAFACVSRSAPAPGPRRKRGPPPRPGCSSRACGPPSISSISSISRFPCLDPAGTRSCRSMSSVSIRRGAPASGSSAAQHQIDEPP